MICGLSAGGLILTYRCNAACRHCLYKSSPRRDGAYMNPETLRGMLRKAASLGCRSFHLGGGEPFLDFDGLLAVVEVMAEEGIAVDYLETNAGWFEEAPEARRRIRELAAAGVGTVMVSLCPFHVEFVPLAKAEGVISACRDAGTGCFVWQEQYRRELSRLDPQRVHGPSELREAFGEDYVLGAAERFGLTLNGRALRTFAPALRKKSVEEILQENPGGCGELLRTGHFHLDPSGAYVPPGCVGFVLRVDDLGAPLNEEAYRRFLTAARDGIAGLLGLAADEAGFAPDAEGYVSKCHLCEDIRRALVAAAGESGAIPDLGPAEFYAMA